MKINKAISLLVAGSFLSMSMLPVFAEEYMVLPPILDETTTKQDQPLPDFSKESNYEIKTNNYNTNNSNFNDYSYDTNYKYEKNYANTNAQTTELLKGTVSTVPVGTAFQVITNDNVTTQRNTVGEIFSATLNHPISVDGKIIVPAGSEVIGQVTYVEDAGRVGKNAKMEIKFTSIKPPFGNRIPIAGKILTQDNTGILKGGKIGNQLVSNVKTEAMITAGGTVVGMGLGAVAGSVGTGAAIGAATSGGIGLGWLLFRKGKEVKMPVGTKMVVVLEQPFNVGK